MLLIHFLMTHKIRKCLINSKLYFSRLMWSLCILCHFLRRTRHFLNSVFYKNTTHNIFFCILFIYFLSILRNIFQLLSICAQKFIRYKLIIRMIYFLFQTYINKHPKYDIIRDIPCTLACVRFITISLLLQQQHQ